MSIISSFLGVVPEYRRVTDVTLRDAHRTLALQRFYLLYKMDISAADGPPQAHTKVAAQNNWTAGRAARVLRHSDIPRPVPLIDKSKE